MSLAASSKICDSSSVMNQETNMNIGNLQTERILKISEGKGFKNKESTEFKNKKNVTKIGARNKHYSDSSNKRRKISKASSAGSFSSSINTKLYQENIADLSFQDEAIQGLTKYSLYIWNSCMII